MKEYTVKIAFMCKLRKYVNSPKKGINFDTAFKKSKFPTVTKNTLLKHYKNLKKNLKKKSEKCCKNSLIA